MGNVRRNPSFTYEPARVHMAAKYEKSELWEDVAVDLEAEQAIRERHLRWLSTVERGATQKLRTLAFVQQHVTWY
jgi:hypothetical protein